MMNEEFTDSWEGNGFDLDKTINCLVKFREQTFYSCTYLFKNLISTAVNNQNEFSNIYWGIKRILSNFPDDQSAAVRQFTLNRISNLLPGPAFELLKNSTGCPTLSSAQAGLNIPVSLAHHGCFVGYSFIIQADEK
jgi:hypothetical protein